MSKRILYFGLAAFLILDIGFSFLQHYYTHFDGDMPSFILRTEEWQPVLNDPFGFKVLFNQDSYPDPNRFFSHWFISAYFTDIPILFQNFMSPLDSIYLSCGLIKIIVQIIMILLLAFLIIGKQNFGKDFLIAASLVTPLFQTIGYNGYMGIIDKSNSYFFFYALPFGCLFIFYYILFSAFRDNSSIPLYKIFISIFLCLILPFSGPLISGIVLVINLLLIIIFKFLNVNKSPGNYLINKIKHCDKKLLINLAIILIIISFMSIYSLFIGYFNSINLSNSISLIERYSRLPIGLYYIITQKLGLPLLLIMIILNTIIIYKFHFLNKGKTVIELFKLTMLFSILYILLLPLGGYRFYRPNIIRFDTFMPIIFCLILYYGVSSFYIIKQLKTIKKYLYLFVIISVSFVFTNADKIDYSTYSCERAALEKLSQSPDKITPLNSDCTVMSWKIINDFHDSKASAELLYYWKVTTEKKFYFQK